MLCVWEQVVGGFLVPIWVTYKIQLSSRRQWRKGLLKRRSQDGTDRALSPTRDPGLDIRLTWALHIPESVAVLVLSYVAGTNFQLLQYMV